ncbi:uncharacterized protein LOC143688673 [Tamandua tetradactyla]|uniref:uncharacterized protein LOC143688673 n=1 Tax=Tamandua tetradactyla TaxID=48850 RepID=UPI0040548FD8
MADRLPSLTSAPSLPDLPLSTLTSALTSLLLPRPPAADLGSALATPRHRRRDCTSGSGRMREFTVALSGIPIVCAREVTSPRRKVQVGGSKKPGQSRTSLHSGQGTAWSCGSSCWRSWNRGRRRGGPRDGRRPGGRPPASGNLGSNRPRPS